MSHLKTAGMKSVFLSLVILFCISLSAYAQDKLIKANGSIIMGKVIEVGVKEIRYQTREDPNSATFIIRKAELQRIEFGNGENFIINQRLVDKASATGKRASVQEYGRNIFTFSPFKAIDTGPGLGGSYERLIGENQYLGIIIPVSFVFKNSGYYNPGSLLYDDKYFTNFYVSPGVKIYPFGQRRVTYAVGPNLMMGFLKDLETVYSSYGGRNEYVETNNFRLGIIVNNYLNLQITPKINLGIHAGPGMRYLNRNRSNSNFYDEDFRITGEFAFNFGFRF